MPSGFFVSVKSNSPGWYVAGIILFILIGLAMIIGGFVAGAGVPLGIAGVVFVGAAVLLLVEFLTTR